ncbi:hypothetical protein CAPTEDRAFT_192868 [Capitella teleta]|uniref:Uncharacterized protein n=1 Tax=Capitella teleta TaxID=283909 RepID=R7U798_CAPTE|nr:hypothetical protein CAPTEDRAFT_192868 [Capitella teleta]|eukprot:ELU01996.1 hypothetical protein CAPTEDRAFT_192868 [Capitella teleta]
MIDRSRWNQHGSLSEMSSDSDATPANSPSQRRRRFAQSLRGSLRSSLQEIFVKKQQTLSSSCECRNVVLEHMSAALAKNTKTLERNALCSIVDYPENNYTPLMTMTGLQDGVFTAEISMKHLPPGEDDLKIRVHNFKLEIFLVKGLESAGKAPSSNEYCGSLILPIFVNPSSLDVSIDPLKDIMSLKAFCK